MSECKRCGGKGHIHWIDLRGGINSGVCPHCHGTGIDPEESEGEGMSENLQQDLADITDALSNEVQRLRAENAALRAENERLRNCASVLKEQALQQENEALRARLDGASGIIDTPNAGKCKTCKFCFSSSFALRICAFHWMERLIFNRENNDSVMGVDTACPWWEVKGTCQDHQ